MENQNPSVLAAFSAPVVPAVKKNFRITTTMYLNWPELNFELFSNESGKTNDFESPESLSPEVSKHLTGFIRSGHVRFYDMRPVANGEAPKEITPMVAEANADGTAPPDTDPTKLAVGTPNADKPNPNAPIPQSVASSDGTTGDGTPIKDRAARPR